MKTQTELQKLKTNWLNDPCWDIETTEGFEDHKVELLLFRKLHEGSRAVYQLKETIEYADHMGIPENLILARYILNLESRLERLENDSHTHEE